VKTSSRVEGARKGHSHILRFRGMGTVISEQCNTLKVSGRVWGKEKRMEGKGQNGSWTKRGTVSIDAQKTKLHHLVDSKQSGGVRCGELAKDMGRWETKLKAGKNKSRVPDDQSCRAKSNIKGKRRQNEVGWT